MRGISVIILLGLMPPALGQAAGAPPVIHFSMYAPPQEPPPVDAPERKPPAHIVGFQNDRTVVRFLVSNDSDKPVIGVAIAYFGVAPEGCRAEPGTWPAPGANSERAGTFLVRIAPHGRGVTNGIGNPSSRSPAGWAAHDPKLTLQAAQRLRAAYIQVQVGIYGVWFEDGSTWPAHWRGDTPPGHAGPFDASLIEAEAGKCTDVATVANALQSIKEIVFGPQTPPAPDSDDAGSAIPHLRFSCSLEGPKGGLSATAGTTR